MTILTDESLEFARLHIIKFYDSDFFPKPIEFDALWHNWEDVKKDLTNKNVGKMFVTSPRVFPVPKPSGDFRIVHQLEPVDALIYTALAYEVVESIEKSRIPEDERVACSYRFKVDEGNFFSGGTGFPEFIEQTELLAKSFNYILSTDIADFFNQIYLHRLNNTIEYSDKKLKGIGDDIENFITNLNGKASQGIPVGPAASIVMSEAVLMDIDQFIRSLGTPHTRYVDDIRIFGQSEDQLKKVQQDLTLYLYNAHRLILNAAKTSIQDSKTFVSSNLHNPLAEENVKLFKSIEVFNPYVEDFVELELEMGDGEESITPKLIHIVNHIIDQNYLNLGLSRSAIRRARQYGVDEIAELIIPNIKLFSPIINDVVLYFAEVTDDSFIDKWRTVFGEVVHSNALDSYVVRFWMDWYLSSHVEYLTEPEIRKFIHNTPHFLFRAKAAITEGDLAWVRQQKGELPNLGGWARRALLNAARVLPSDERNHWLKLTETSSPILIDRWVAKWVRETA